MFAYCNNNPVCHADPTGEVLIEIILAAGEVVAILVCGVAIFYCGVMLLTEFFTWLSKQWYKPFATIQYKEVEETLPQQGLVEGDPESPPVDAGKQGKHVSGHKNHNPDKSTWPEGQNGVEQTQEAWNNGVQDPKKPNQNVRIGIASDGTVVRVHMDGNGAIHGYPLFPICWP